MKDCQNTIAAISTPEGTGAVSIIRLSGGDAKKIALSLVKVKSKNLTPNVCYRGEFCGGGIKDDCIIIYFKAPASYTGEDVVEIHCHGGVFIQTQVLNACVGNGCRPAENGEFTRRAFLNGKIDLSQAEAVIDLIEAQSSAQANAAYSALRGEIKTEASALQREILDILAAINAAIDYPEEDIEEETAENIKAVLTSINKKLGGLIASFSSGRLIREGVRAVIAGSPNTGKSSLMNALLKTDRAIVSPAAGTTRDTIEEAFTYGGLKFVLTDTAGIRAAGDETERMGIERANRAVSGADIVISLKDASAKFDGSAPAAAGNKKIITVYNKRDLLSAAEQKNPVFNDGVLISAKTGENIDGLLKALCAAAVSKPPASGAVLTNARHYAAAAAANALIEHALTFLQTATLDCVSADLERAYSELCKITGATASADIIDGIFSRFCVGK
ncbi:MAG: tRNA uridine-5-carboxymethylaminomethyl(34) synthesis GTPase MnmE [Clostridiales bacterium]|jgi:tRNA modification GTPase|nr:tRNA uridine-5-carboxymethylaminomethyl(34) synthesis GTPase MnmE [Clostridiales bacterium]